MCFNLNYNKIHLYVNNNYTHVSFLFFCAFSNCPSDLQFCRGKYVFLWQLAWLTRPHRPTHNCAHAGIWSCTIMNHFYLYHVASVFTWFSLSFLFPACFLKPVTMFLVIVEFWQVSWLFWLFLSVVLLIHFTHGAIGRFNFWLLLRPFNWIFIFFESTWWIQQLLACNKSGWQQHIFILLLHFSIEILNFCCTIPHSCW